MGKTGMVVVRKLPIERHHWVASMRGFRHLPQYGVAYIHTDGSITLGQHNREVACKCGVTHMF